LQDPAAVPEKSQILPVSQEELMRQYLGFCVVLLSCGLASGQTSWVEPGTYSQPFTPRLSTPSAAAEVLVTPSLALDSPSSTTGATNGTTSRAIDTGVHFNQPVWYAPGVQFDQPLFLDSSIDPAQTQVNFIESASRKHRTFESGAGRSQDSYGVAQLTGKGVGRKQSRVFTNSDVARLNEANGTVKYAGKLEPAN
jgi:hypothetical protein